MSFIAKLVGFPALAAALDFSAVLPAGHHAN